MLSSDVRIYAPCVRRFVDDALPLWAMAPPGVGGLDYQADTIGTVLGSVGVLMLLFQLFCYAPIAQRLRMRRSYLVAMATTAPLTLALPTIAGVAGSAWVSGSPPAVHSCSRVQCVQRMCLCAIVSRIYVCVGSAYVLFVRVCVCVCVCVCVSRRGEIVSQRAVRRRGASRRRLCCSSALMRCASPPS